MHDLRPGNSIDSWLRHKSVKSRQRKGIHHEDTTNIGEKRKVEPNRTEPNHVDVPSSFFLLHLLLTSTTPHYATHEMYYLSSTFFSVASSSNCTWPQNSFRVGDS